MNQFKSAALLVAAISFSSSCVAQVAIKGAIVYTMAGAAIRDGVVVIENGKISAIGPASSTKIPDGFRVLSAAIVTPGLVDPRGTVGLTGLYNSPHDSDQIEHSTPMQPELRAIDAYNPQEKLIEWVRSYGVTTVNTGHAPGELISGQTMVVKLRGNTVDQAVVVPAAMLAATLGPSAEKGEGKSPGTRGKMFAMLREEFVRAGEYREKLRKAKIDEHKPSEDKAEAKSVKDKKEPADPDRSLRQEMLVKVLDGELPLLVNCNRAQDIASVLRLAKEFNIHVILESAAEAYLLTNEIKAAGVSVIVHPLMQRAVGETENQSFETPKKLAASGIPFAIETGYEGYVPKVRVLLFEAAIAATNGLTFEQALASITIDSAKIIGVSNRVGSLEVGKDGDVALYDGDPFEYTSHCTGVVIDGNVVSETKR